MNPYYPVYLDLRGKRCLVFGGNGEAEKKVPGLLIGQAKLEVFATELTPRLQGQAQSGAFTWRQRGYRAGDLAGAFLAIVADTANPKVNQDVYDEAQAQGTLLNVADITYLCNWIAPAVTRRGPVTVAASTGGISPALARRLKDELDLSPRRGTDCCLAWADGGEVLGSVRADLRRRGVQVPAARWQVCMTEDILAMCQRGDTEKAKQVLTERLEAGAQHAAPARG
ncbi:MAG: bifunctional precorrin-2 dehydrogenase/sirohydrochlorin ferrochelatase [Dehalococcoidia bacterium]|nr:bifunctional precorrin-2 dehydrogenase/sirohydrochlorin ferrochelatase [Dehalococcoidia bacterium]